MCRPQREMWVKRNKGTPGERMNWCGCAGGWGAEMHEWRNWEELSETWREANGGQTEHEELACDGSCPGLILSVCAGWQKGCKGRLARPLLADTHGTFGLIWTEGQQIDGLRYLKHWQKQTFCEFSYNHQLQTCSPPHPLDSPLLICPRVLNPLTVFIYTQTVHTLLRHLVLHQQVVGLEKGRSHRGVGSCEG